MIIQNNNYYNILIGLENKLYTNKISKEIYNKHLTTIIKEIHDIGTEEANTQLNNYLIETEQYINENEQVLLENDVFTWRDTRCGISLRIDGDGKTNRNFDMMPYFKIYTGKNYKSAIDITRISMTPGEPFYIIHNNQIWNIPNDILKKVYEFLNATNPDPQETNWAKMLKAAINVSKNPEEIKKHLSITVPRYDLGVKFLK